MPSEEQQYNAQLEQPWKKWQADLGQADRRDDYSSTNNLTETVCCQCVNQELEHCENDSCPCAKDRGCADECSLCFSGGNHGTTSLNKRHVNFNIDKQKPVIETLTLRHQAVKSLFGLPVTHILDWDGILIFFCHLEYCFQELLDPCFESIWKLLGRTIPSTSVDAWHWCFAVINAYDSLSDRDPSIERIYQQILKVSGKVVCTPSEEDKKHILQAIFAILCWTSSTIQPLVGKKAAEHSQSISDQHHHDEEMTCSVESTTLFAENCSRVYSSTNIRRPASKMFHSYRFQADGYEFGGSAILPIGVITQAPGYHYEAMLYESSLNYDSLSRIGRIRIRLVDNLTAHLAFDSTTRELSMYRYPSFCVTKILSRHKVELLESITEKLLSPQCHLVNSTREADSIYREVLLSYRLIFGQSHKSRKIMSRVFSHSQSASGVNHVQLVGVTPNEELDPFLKTLCTSPLHSGCNFLGLRLGGKPTPNIRGDLFPSSALNEHDELSELDYSAQDHFPTFGPRLLALQRYNMRRQPSKILDLWRDQRNPLQWYTFWAVLLIGVIGFLLSIFQLAVSIIQVVYAANPAT
ncbi:hypothetical protein F4806DRAFT_504915 [Annulohypoxylon nitens]|nr:hypothetical protein F4806DRAFT_504915 [Annulohypoxylon nitens]